MSEALIKAVLKRDIEQVKKLVKDGADVNFLLSDFENHPILYLAISNDDLEMVKLLLELGADVNLDSRIKFEAASSCNHFSESVNNNIFKYLLENGLNVEGLDKYNRTLLHWLVGTAQPELVRKVISHVDVNAQDIEGNTALMLASVNFSASKQNMFLIINMLIEADADVNIKNNKDKTVLDFNLIDGLREEIQILFEKHALNKG